MSVNIFGASKIITRGDGKKGERGIGFNLDSYDNFDIGNRRLVNVAEPLAENDAATKAFVVKIRDAFTEDNEHLVSRLTEVEDKIVGSEENLNVRLTQVEGKVEELDDEIASEVSALKGDDSSIRAFVTRKALNPISTIKQQLTQLEAKIDEFIGDEEASRVRRDASVGLTSTIDELRTQVEQNRRRILEQDGKINGVISDLPKSFEYVTTQIKNNKLGVEQNMLDIADIRHNGVTVELEDGRVVNTHDVLRE